MGKRFSVVAVSVAVALILVFAGSLAGGGTARAKQAKQAAHNPLAGYSLKNPPKVLAVSKAKKYSGQSIIFYGDQTGIGNQVDNALAKQFQKQTGVNVKVIGKPANSDDALAAYERIFSGHSNKLDVAMIDTVWPATLAADLVDLKPALGSTTKNFYSTLISNDTVNGHLVGIPEFGDLGMLYYRKDLLTKYHISKPPTTWDQLAADAKKIQTGEQKSNKNFHGFVFQGKAYEGLTCDALEWLASSGGGTIVSGSKVTLNNPKAAKMLDKVRGWVGAITPRDVTTYTETEADNDFNNGNAAFMRNWPYAYAIAQTTKKIAGKVGVVPLPHESGYSSVGTVGGWQLAVSKYSSHPAAAAEFVRYVTQPSTSTWLAVVGTFVPTQPATSSNKAVLKAMPFLKVLQKTTRVPRPARFLGTKYNEFSTRFFQGINQILNGQSASSVLPGIQNQLQRLMP